MITQIAKTPLKLIGGEKLSTTAKLALKQRILVERGLGGKFPPKTNREATEGYSSETSSEVQAICGFDWLTATGWIPGSFHQYVDENGEILEKGIPCLASTLDYLQRLIKSYWPDCADFLDDNAYSVRGYNRAFSWYSGKIKICWAEDSEGLPKLQQRCYFCVSGSLLEQLDFQGQVDLFKSLFIDFDFNPTRADTYVRDFSFLVLPGQLKTWADSGFLCRFRHKNFRYIESGINGEDGTTFYAGRRTKNGVSGDCLYRCYDESVESRSPVPAIKHEVEWSGHKVKSLVARFKALFETHYDYATGKMDEQAFTKFCLESTVGAGVLDFREGEHTSKLDSRVVVSEWAAFTESIDKVRIQGKVKKPEIDAFPAVAFIHQWGRKLAKESNKDPRFKVEALITTLALVESDISRILTQAIQSGERRLSKGSQQRIFAKQKTASESLKPT